jgi:hypothetical protein
LNCLGREEGCGGAQHAQPPGALMASKVSIINCVQGVSQNMQVGKLMGPDSTGPVQGLSADQLLGRKLWTGDINGCIFAGSMKAHLACRAAFRCA